MEDYKNMSLEELEVLKEELEKENNKLVVRRTDVDLYQKLYEKYVSDSCFLVELNYGKLCDHPDYYTKWRNTFFDKYNRLIHRGIYTRYSDEPVGLSIPERKKIRQAKQFCPDETSNLLTLCRMYDICCNGIGTFESLLRTPENMHSKPVGLDIDCIDPILGFCDAVKKTDGRYQLHLTDPTGDCLFPPFDITAEEAELALGRICVVTCVYNFFAAAPKLWELQILPFTLTEKLGEYDTDTIIIERDFPVKTGNYAELM